MFLSLKLISKNIILLGLFLILSHLPASAAAHFDYDNKADFAVFRPNDSHWYAYSSERESFSGMQWGLPTDRLVPADYDGDGLTDCAVWRPETGDWFVFTTKNKQFLSLNWGKQASVFKGFLPDEPVVGDYDGDGTIDFAVWRPDNGVWYVLNSSTGFNPQRARIVQWGKLGDIPVPADYDGDGKTDLAVFRYSENRWYVFQSKLDSWKTSTLGIPGSDLLVPADYTGDGKADFAVYRDGQWIIERSEDGKTETQSFGLANDVPVPADYDGDNRIDYAVYRRGTWFVRQSSNNQMASFNFGNADDIPLNSINVKPSIIGVP